MDSDGPDQPQGDLQSGTLGTRSGPRATDGSDGDCAVWKSGTRVRVKVHHHSNRQVKRCLGLHGGGTLDGPLDRSERSCWKSSTCCRCAGLFWAEERHLHCSRQAEQLGW